MRIVEALRRDGRVSTHELADQLGLSRTTTARRLSHLLDGGFVSVVGLVHPLTIGIKSLAHISISVDRPVRRVHRCHAGGAFCESGLGCLSAHRRSPCLQRW